MSRTILNIRHNRSEEEAKQLVENFLMQNDFKRLLYNNIEEVWRKGTGMMTAMQFIKPEFNGDVLKLSAWVQVGVGNMGGKERDLGGITAAMPKKSLKKIIEQIKQIV